MSDPEGDQAMTEQVTLEEKRYEVTVYVMQKFVIERTATCVKEAEDSAIDMTGEEPPVDSYVSDVKTKELGASP